jgi:hypothetical protein
VVVTNCGRICLGRKKINLSTVFAGQAVGLKKVHDEASTRIPQEIEPFRKTSRRVR